MSLPVLKKCCWCLTLETGCFLLAFLSTLACIFIIGVGSWELPHHNERQPEDNLISMSLVMFGTLSLITNIIALVGVIRRRAGYIKVSLLFNSVFVVCILLVAVVTCIFSPELEANLQNAGNVVLVTLLIIFGAGFAGYYLIALNSLVKKFKVNYSESSLPVPYY